MRKLVVVLLVLLSFFTQAQENPVHWKFETKKLSDCDYELIFKAKIDEPWHIYSLVKAGEDGPNPTSFVFNKSKDYQLVGKVVESTPTKVFDKVFEMNVAYHPKNATFTQKIKLLAAGKVKINGTYEAQVCTEEKCIFPPADKFEFELEGTPACAGMAVTETTSVDSTKMLASDCKCDTAAIVLAKGGTMSAKTVSLTSKINEEDKDTTIEGSSWWVIFLGGLGWGFAALFTPCVFPLIPLNISFFLKQSKTPSKGKLNALSYAMSIIVIFVTLGLGISMLDQGGSLNSFATSVGFNIVIFILLLVFAASFLGAFEITLPSGLVNKIDRQGDKGGFIGIFFMALALVVVSFSCTGPMIGNALVLASTSGNISGAFWAMFGFSMGLALPFGVLAFFPTFLNTLPKSGGWLNSVKVVLGFVELALAFKFASNADLVLQAGYLTREVFISLWIVISLLLSLYLIGVFKTAHDSDVKHLSVTRLFFAIAAFFFTFYLIPGLWGAPLKILSGILPPLEYSESPHGFGGGSGTAALATTQNIDPEFAKHIEVNKNGIVHFKNDYEHALAYAKKVGKPLMVDFTGHACANCRKTEDYVWPDANVVKRLNNEVVLVSLYVDDKRALDPKDYMTVNWFGKEREITDIGDKFKYMEETLYGQSSQPLYVLLDHNEKPLNKVRGYNPNIEEYINWLDEGITKFKSKDKKTDTSKDPD